MRYRETWAGVHGVSKSEYQISTHCKVFKLPHQIPLQIYKDTCLYLVNQSFTETLDICPDDVELALALMHYSGDAQYENNRLKEAKVL
jgi:hypothetical protein